MRPTAAIQGIPRNRRHEPVNLPEEKRKTKSWISYYPPIGIVGLPGSGRKTLGYRFGHERLNNGPFHEEVPVRQVYGHHSIDKLQSGRDSRILLKFYIMDQGNMPPRKPPGRIQEWNEFCCMVIVFDINEKKTFRAVPSFLSIFREDFFDIKQNFFVVGNKRDLRRTDEARHNQVSKRAASGMAELLGVTYYECSAKENQNISELLCAIKGISAKYLERYLIQ